MTTVQNLHTHSVYCDGHSTFAQTIESAVRHNLKSIGFSGHSHTGFPFDVANMSAENQEKYFAELTEVKKTAPLEVFIGLELESSGATFRYPNKDSRCDYAIGSAHFYHKDDKCYYVDWDLEHWYEAVEVFGGVKPLMENYYSELVSFAKASDYDIVGHFDLFTKFCEMTDQSFINEAWYKDIAYDAMDAVFKRGKIFEINTGAISRNFKHTVYPELDLLKRLKQINAPVIITSDCHSAENIVFYFEETEEMLKSLGFKTQMMLTKRGFTEVPL